MKIFFSSLLAERACASIQASEGAWGAVLAAVVRRRLYQLAASESLAVVKLLVPARLHRLTAPHVGQFSVDAAALIIRFEPELDDPEASITGPQIDLADITAIRIHGIEAPHER